MLTLETSAAVTLGVESIKSGCYTSEGKEELRTGRRNRLGKRHACSVMVWMHSDSGKDLVSSHGEPGGHSPLQRMSP